jgi:hypothetical protein
MSAARGIVDSFDHQSGQDPEDYADNRARDAAVVSNSPRAMPNPKSLVLFEAVINAVHKAAPASAIAFNTRLEDTGEATERWLGRRARA